MPLQTSYQQTRLDFYYQRIQRVILSRQNPVTGLLPASTAITTHGDYTDAWVRDNVYSILAVWGLALGYRKMDEARGRTYELEHSVVKLMRGLLFAMMSQAGKVEQFKQTQSLKDALHAKYDTATGATVVGDDEWGHLQLDATSLYLLMLAQMTTSGLQIIYTTDEVNFVQNLVYYIGRTYRTPDYGIWERGNKINQGDPELNASSVGMAKAALEAMNGCNLFGIQGGPSSVIHVLPDEIARARITLESLLPRESSSKEVDAATLSVIGFPAFAVEDEALVDRTRQKIVDKLEGRYGCKRFLRDGHQTVLEDTNRLHYEPLELKEFEHIECEWPLFFAYLLLDGIFRGDRTQVEKYQQRLQEVAVDKDGVPLLPELYYVPLDKVEAERAQPHSQPRLPNDNVPLIWAQSLYWLGQLLEEGAIDQGDIDPLGRHRSVGRQRSGVVQVALLAESEALQAELADCGIKTETPQQVEPIQVRQAKDLSEVFTQIGRNDKLKLTGRPVRRLRSLTTSRIFRLPPTPRQQGQGGEPVVFLPSFLDPQEFYLNFDYHFLVAQIRGELAYIQRHWRQMGRPTLTLMLTHRMFESGRDALLSLLRELQEGDCRGVQVQVGRLNQLISVAGWERFEFLHDFEFSRVSVKDATPAQHYLAFDPDKTLPLSNTEEFSLECETDVACLCDRLRQSANLYEQVELLQVLVRLQGLSFDLDMSGAAHPTTVAHLLEEVYFKAAQASPQLPPYWGVIRYAAGLLGKVDIGLSDAVTDIVVRQKQIAVGKAYYKNSLISRPQSHGAIVEKICQFCGEDVRDRVLTQELLIYLSVLIKSNPDLFKGFLTIRTGHLILLLTSELAYERQLTQDEAYEELTHLSPFEIKTRLKQVMEGYAGMNQLLQQQESLHLRQLDVEIDWAIVPDNRELETPAISWQRQRQIDGTAGRVPPDFYPRVWEVMKHCRGLAIGDKLERRNRLDSDLILSEMTPGEKNFALRVEHLLNKIASPQYRQLNIEVLMELSEIAHRNPNLQIEEYIVLDVLIGHAVRLSWLGRHPNREERYDDDKAAAWHTFYDMSPTECAGYIVKAFQFLTSSQQTSAA